MSELAYRAIVVDRPLPDARPEAVLRTLEAPASPAEDGVELDVLFSSVNYKDALALTGAPGVLRSVPLTPGIDAVGRVRADAHGFAAGEIVTVNGAGLGERVDGALAERAVVPAWAAVRRSPESARRAAAVGTAGFTAALALERLRSAGVAPDGGEILVTGAAGGVGSFAVALLSRAGYRVVAMTGREAQADRLRALGASEIVGRDAVASSDKPLQGARWAAAVDSVGSATLAGVLAQTRPGGVVAACGLAQGADLPATVLPFILREVTLAGVNSVDASAERRRLAWDDLDSLPEDVVESIAPRTEPLERATTVAREVLAGRVAGRVVIDVTS